jgi:ferritin-like metal-binding protein YciE
MAQDQLREKLTDYIEDAHAMERSVLRMLDSIISITSAPRRCKRRQSAKNA